MTTAIDHHTRERAQATFARHLELLSSGRVEQWVDLFTDDGVLEFPYGPDDFPEKVSGKAALEGYMQNFPKTFDVEFTGLRFHETTDPSVVIAEFSSRGTARSTGRPYDQTYISVVETRDGLITRYVDFWNPLVAMTALETTDDFYGSFTAGG